MLYDHAAFVFRRQHDGSDSLRWTQQRQHVPQVRSESLLFATLLQSRWPKKEQRQGTSSKTQCRVGWMSVPNQDLIGISTVDHVSRCLIFGTFFLNGPVTQTIATFSSLQLHLRRAVVLGCGLCSRRHRLRTLSHLQLGTKQPLHRRFQQNW